MILKKLEGTYYAVVEPSINVFEFPIVSIEGEPAIYSDVEDAKEKKEELDSVQGERFEVFQLSANHYETNGGEN